MQALRQRLPHAESFGCGGERMRAAGCRTLVDAREIAMVGLVEVIPGLERAWKELGKLRQAIDRDRPQLAILIDFPDFNLRLAKHLKRRSVPVLYFVAPQVWAWRQWRVNAIRRNVDRLLCIFPFEEAFFRNAGINVEFIGHPLAGRVKPSLTAAEFRRRFAIPEETTLIALLPGSRRKEILLNLPPMLEAARLLAAARPCNFVLPVASTISADWMRQQVAAAKLPLTVVEHAAYDAVAHADAAIVASGTASTETALLGTPMVIVYRVSASSWMLGRWLVRVPFLSMVNLVAGREIVPELIQDRFEPQAVARQIGELLDNPARRERLKADLKEFAARLQTPSVGASAAEFSAKDFADPIQRAAAIAESMVTVAP
jgi:lipid-A-disaccharide synthase